VIIVCCALPAYAEDGQAAELAKKLANPISSLISVPLQYNCDEYGGVNDGAAVSRLFLSQQVKHCPCSAQGKKGA